MMLPFSDGLIPTSESDGEMAVLADRHYSRRTVGARRFVYSGRKLILRDYQGTCLFAWLWMYPELRMDKQLGIQCVIFRNESQRRSSEIILEAEEWAVRKWGPQRMFTYVDPTKVKSRNPGWCFLCAGWKRVGYSKYGKHLLAKEPSNIGSVLPRVRPQPWKGDTNVWRDGVAIIKYREQGVEKTWGVGCLIGTDNEKTMREHLFRWKPGADFISVEFQEVGPAKKQEKR